MSMLAGMIERKERLWEWLRPAGRRLAVLAAVSALLVVIPLSAGLFEGLELVLLDMRFTTRSWWREPVVDSSVITVDWDEPSIQVVGRWPWTWDRHAVLVDLLGLFGARQIGIVDDHFSTPGAITVADEAAGALGASLASSLASGAADPASAGLPRHNEDFADVVAAHGRVFLCADFFIPNEKGEGGAVAPRDDDHLAAIDLLDTLALKPPSGYAAGGSLPGAREALDMKPPIPLLSRVVAGAGFNRIVQDRDGVVRRLPAVVAYDGRYYPTLAVTMAADRFGLRSSDIRVAPGEWLEFPGAAYPDGRPVRIPIDENGDMLVNWVGGYFEHIPHVPFLSLAQQHAFLVGKRVAQGIEPDLADPTAIDMALQAVIGAILSERLVTQEDAVIVGFAVVDALYAEKFQEQGRTWEEFLAVYLAGSDTGQLGRQRWDAVRLNHAAAARLDAGETVDYAALLAECDALDTESLRDNFEQLQWFHSRGDLAAMRPLLFYQNRHRLSDEREVLWSPLVFRDKSVFVGLTATALNALNPTPFEPRYQMLGLQPNAANTILTGDFLTEQPAWATYAYVLVYAFVITFLVLRLGTLAQLGVALGLAGAHASVAWWAFGTRGVILPVVAPLLAVALSYTGTVIFLYAEAQRERRRVRGLFSAMVSPQVLRILEENPEKLSIAGEKFDATMFSSDVSGFTTISEGVTAQGLANILNIYLTPMSNIIMKYDGFVDKYEGDAIKAEFGVPLTDVEHPWKGVCAALEQQEELTVIARMLLLMYGVKITARMGVNTGVVAAGNMGSEKRMQYTVMGEQVTLAEELEPINKLYESWIAIGPETEARSRHIIETRHLDTVIMGPSHAVLGIHEPLGWKEDAYLAYWRDRPVPPLLLEAIRRLMPEKILGYVYYYERRVLAPTPMGEKIVGTYRRLAPIAIDFMKTNDVLAVLGYAADMVALQGGIEALPGGTEASAAVEQDGEGWQKKIFAARAYLRGATNRLEAAASTLDPAVADDLAKSIDTLEKKVESFWKRCSFPTPEDPVGWDLAAHLKEILVNESAEFLEQAREPLEKRAMDLRRQIQEAMNALAAELETREGASAYHEFLAAHCAVTDRKRQVRDAFAAARACYVKRDWDGAEAGFRAALALDPEDGPSLKYIERIQHLRKSPPDAGWGGVWAEE